MLEIVRIIAQCVDNNLTKYKKKIIRVWREKKINTQNIDKTNIIGIYLISLRDFFFFNIYTFIFVSKWWCEIFENSVILLPKKTATWISSQVHKNPSKSNV